MRRSYLSISPVLLIAMFSPSSAWARGGSCGKSLLCDISGFLVLCFVVFALVGGWLSKRSGQNSARKESKKSPEKSQSVTPEKNISP